MRIACLEQQKGCVRYEYVDRNCHEIEVENVESYFAMLEEDGYKITSRGEDGLWEAYKFFGGREFAKLVTSDMTYFDGLDWLED